MKHVMIALVKFYRRNISPLLGPHCRYAPTCSEYSLQAFEKYGFFKGLYLSVFRILRCNPLFKGGYDPLK
ncbi:membrane protein insertion efficiency factor YidD [Acidaminobacter sp. JC074]|uniref:membrane protein insertion efficiency factor YidD n=1 Tax=Acidaminobacter sp. JC074 TaxID=2530199 RepID=UPI001F10CFAC|nr:membrane protein insertion efficiency factor YidD [Acidaminobacter sp. JC074]MCH4891232.1 membrane protein insertion efficiency factor YidD [Acidaminobacter sp. JC074]